ncbi:flagellar assembly protein FliH [Tepidiphilus sp. J10]|uniref:flagellar assembly protein FliH n=1 Tax=Tepidiphilus sp. J10 TaxID=2502185 RepID=UPI00115F3AD8|nr:flagellar assembly protein FliH [Tepidiphilus sp. J10]
MAIDRHQATGLYRPWQPPSFDEAENRRDRPSVGAEAARQGVQLPTVEELESLYEQSRREGFAAGHEEGYAAGHAEGLAQGQEEGRRQGHQEGYAKGEAEGRAQGEAQARAQYEAQWQQRLALADSLIEGLEHLAERTREALAEEIAALAVEIARHVLQDELRTSPERIVSLVRRLLEEEGAPHLTIRLHPEDLSLVREGLDAELAKGGHRLIADASIARGGCLVESDSHVTDATLPNRWRRLVARLWPESASWGEETHVPDDAREGAP